MSTIKFESDYSKIQKKKRIETLIAKQKRVLLCITVCRYFIFERKMLKP